MLMNTFADRLSTSVEFVPFRIDSVKKLVSAVSLKNPVSAVSLITTKLNLKHASVMPTSNVTEVVDVTLASDLPYQESVLN